MKDPWRVVEPLRPEAEEKHDPADRDWDADIRPSFTRVIGFKHCSIMVQGPEVGDDEAALARLAACITELKAAGFSTGHEGQPVDRGSLALVRALTNIARFARGSEILRKHGVTPMLRST